MLENKSLANKKVATVYGDINFDDKGQSKDLTAAQQKELGKLPGFKYVEEKKAPAKAPAKKAPAKKAPAKKEEAKKEEK